MGPSLYLLEIPTFLGGFFCFLFCCFFVVVVCFFCLFFCLFFFFWGGGGVCFSFQPVGLDWFSKKGFISFFEIFKTGAHQY